jgi:hypothetical protein
VEYLRHGKRYSRDQDFAGKEIGGAAMIIAGIVGFIISIWGLIALLKIADHSQEIQTLLKKILNELQDMNPERKRRAE